MQTSLLGASLSGSIGNPDGYTKLSSRPSGGKATRHGRERKVRAGQVLMRRAYGASTKKVQSDLYTACCWCPLSRPRPFQHRLPIGTPLWELSSKPASARALSCQWGEEEVCRYSMWWWIYEGLACATATGAEAKPAPFPPPATPSPWRASNEEANE